MTIYTPQRGTKEFPPTYVPVPTIVRDAVLNPLPDGTLVRATLGPNIVEGVTKHVSSLEQYAVLHVIPAGQKRGKERDLSLDLDCGWRIEVLAVVGSTPEGTTP